MMLSNMRRVTTINQKNAKHVSHIQSRKSFTTAMKITWLGPQQLVLCCHFSILTQREPLKSSKIAYLRVHTDTLYNALFLWISLWFQLFVPKMTPTGQPNISRRPVDMLFWCVLDHYVNIVLVSMNPCKR